jgi:hypothetical protein
MEMSLKRLFKFVFIGFTMAALGCDSQETGEQGVLEGKISIGPICPVESVPPQPQCLPTAETYKAYAVGIWAVNGSRLLDTLRPDLTGNYRAELQAGSYLVRLINSQAVGGSNLPAVVTVPESDTTRFNIDIDTGIR